MRGMVTELLLFKVVLTWMVAEPLLFKILTELDHVAKREINALIPEVKGTSLVALGT